MSGKIVSLLMALGACMFCGIIIIAAGVANFFPVLNQVAGPVVCRSQRLEIDQHVRSYLPGRTDFNITAYCVDDQTGTKQDETGQVQLASGVIYGMAIFGLGILASVWGYFKSRAYSPRARNAG